MSWDQKDFKNEPDAALAMTVNVQDVCVCYDWPRSDPGAHIEAQNLHTRFKNNS